MKSIQSKPPLPTQTLMVNVRTRLSAAEGRGLTDTGGLWEMKSGSAETGPDVERPRVVIAACVRAQVEQDRHSVTDTVMDAAETSKHRNNETSQPEDAKQRIKRLKNQL